MPKLFDTQLPVTTEILQYLWSKMASNNRSLASVAEELATAAQAKAGQNRFDALFVKQGNLLVTANELQQSLEQAHKELGIEIPSQKTN
jgi:hypothetical protein